MKWPDCKTWNSGEPVARYASAIVETETCAQGAGENGGHEADSGSEPPANCAADGGADKSQEAGHGSTFLVGILLAIL